uniref:Uncharacterized protein n=1 Tax=Romanomermis culicivorax TaxID=13658 RepID=A0A915HND7_ROMCU
MVNFSFYDMKRDMKKMWAYKVDQSASVLKDGKVFEADTSSLSCPPSYETKSPYHRRLMQFLPPSSFLCLEKNVQARRNFKPDKWYVVEWDETKFAQLDRAAIVNDTFKAHLTILDSGMRFNISLKPDYFTPSILNVTVQPNEKNAIVEQPGVSRMIREGSLIVLLVKPWLTEDSSGCTIATDFQTIDLYERNLRGRHNFG